MILFIILQSLVLAARNTLTLEHMWFDLSERHEFHRRPINGLTYSDFTGQERNQRDFCDSQNMLISCLLSPDIIVDFIEHYLDDFIIVQKKPWSHGIGVGLAYDQSPSEPKVSSVSVPYAKVAQLIAKDVCDTVNFGLRPVLYANKESPEVCADFVVKLKRKLRETLSRLKSTFIELKTGQFIRCGTR